MSADRGGPAAELPVCQVVVDVPLAHLDRPFDYLVPASMASDAAPGVRVKVRFSGRDVNGFVVARSAASDFPRRLSPLRRVVSAEPVLSPGVLALCRAVADRYAGTLADVLRLAVPPRHARIEAESGHAGEPAASPDPEALLAAWEAEAGGPALVRRLARGESPRAAWCAVPGADWAGQLAAAAAAVASSGRGSLLLAPDAAHLARLDRSLTAVLGAGRHVVLSADLGPAARYRAFLAALRGRVPIVAGTRAAVFAPVSRLGLVALWDDGNDLYVEPRAPYPHAREVLVTRAHQAGAAALVGGFGRSVEAQLLVSSGWAAGLSAPRPAVRAAAPEIHVAGERGGAESSGAAAASRMPREVFETVRTALRSGPVLVHVPRAGYLPALGCGRCRRPVTCSRCGGPVVRPAPADPARCRVCGTPAPRPWTCPHCAAHTMRATVVGSTRTAEEWGRAFPATRVLSSGGDHVLAEVGAAPAIVVATPGAEPTAADGYAAAVIMDTRLTLALGMRAGEEALRRWLTLSALVRSRGAGGRVVAVGEPSLPTLQALVRWDPEGYAARELTERRAAGLSPAYRMAAITAEPAVLAAALEAARLPAGAEVLGPVEVRDGGSRAVVRVERSSGAALSRALQQLQSTRSARKLPAVRVQIDPIEL